MKNRKYENIRYSFLVTGKLPHLTSPPGGGRNKRHEIPPLKKGVRGILSLFVEGGKNEIPPAPFVKGGEGNRGEGNRGEGNRGERNGGEGKGRVFTKVSSLLTFLLLTTIISPRAFAEADVASHGAGSQTQISTYEDVSSVTDIEEEFSSNNSILDFESSAADNDIDPSLPSASDETKEKRIKYQTEANPMTDLSDEAIVDKAEKIPLNATSGFSGKSGVTPQSLALPDGSGTIQGMGESFSPNLNTGSGTFSVPIALPPGRRGLQPQVGLSYSTGSGNGPLGWGWSVGMPFISRQTDKGMPLYDKGDRFMYNGGQELVPIDMPSDEEWPSHIWDSADGDEIIYYRARIESVFMRFFYNRTKDTWLVQDRKGNHYFYGESEYEKMAGPKGTYMWSLSRLADVRRVTTSGGNDVHYEYLDDGGTLYIEDLYWNSYENEYGALNKYQHNAHFVYEPRPDTTVSFATGFRVDQNLRLARVEVSSYQDKPTGERPLTRVYLFTYQNEDYSFHSKLEQIQVCGRDWRDGYGGTCLSPLSLSYTRIPGISPDGTTPTKTVPGFGYLSEIVHNFEVSPDVSVSDENVDFMDINQDGLPDLLVTNADYFGKDHGAILNDGLGRLDSSKAVKIENPAGWSLNLQNLNVSVLDMDGAGNADLLHMPYNEKYHFYRLKGNGSTGEFIWKETDDIPINGHIDFTKDAMDIRLVDINNDHLIDIVRSTGGRMQHFVNLSAFPDYEGQFGRIDESGQPVRNESIDTCILMRGGMMQFHNGNLQFGDMNGDGLQDIVDMKSGSIGYWPNRGYGRWGDSNRDCQAGEYVDQLDIVMENSPDFSNPNNEGVSIGDVNGDGLSDLVQIRFDAVDIWINRGDNSFTDRHIIEDTPITNSGFYHKVRLADINGSGTVDIVWADAGGYKYIDLAGDYRKLDGNGGMPAGLLERVYNGSGASTYIEYATSVEMMVDAREQGNSWDTVAPLPMTVVRKVTTSDNLDEIGGPRGEYIQEFIYRNPFYDGHEAEFKGFGYGESWDRERDADGDGQMDASLCTPETIARGEAPIVRRNWFHRGVRPECMDPQVVDGGGPSSKVCSDRQHMDNPLLGLTGASIMSDVYSPCNEGKVIEATVSEIDVKQLYKSNDPDDDRIVTSIFPNQGRAYKYDPNLEQSSGDSEPYPAVVLDAMESANDLTWTRSYTPVAPRGSFHKIQGNNVIDKHGHIKEAHYGGFYPYTDSYPYEFAKCDGYSDYYVTTFDPQTWVHKATESWGKGPGPENNNTGNCPNWLGSSVKLNWFIKDYNDYGELKNTKIRYWDVEPDGSGGYRVKDNWAEYNTAFREHNDHGQVMRTYGRCTGSTKETCLTSSANYYQYADGDEHYSAFIRQEETEIHDFNVPVRKFIATAYWDAGLSLITKVVGVDGSEGAVEYDDLGRLTRTYGPHPETGKLCNEPVKEVFYHYETAPMPYLETWVNTKSVRCDTKYEYTNTAGIGDWEVMYSYVDSLGRTFAAVGPGDKVFDEVDGESSAYPWMINGYTEHNVKGAAIRSCEGIPISEPPIDPAGIFSLQPKDLNCSKQEFDAYGRPTISYTPSSHPDAVNGYVLGKVEYGLDWGNAYDHLDLTDPCHMGTHSTQRVDGLGRRVYSISRHHPSNSDGEACEGEIVERRNSATYGLGVLLATEKENGVSISKKAFSDSLGRMRVNLGLNFGRWVYTYNTLGDLVQTISPTGDVADYVYDAAGRKKEKYYDGALETEYFYDQYPGDQVLGFDQLPQGEWDGYPTLEQGFVTIGKLVAVKGRTGVSVSASNWGNFSEGWRLLYPENRLYHAETLLDHVGRLEYSDDPDLDRSTADYYPDGTGKSTYWNDYNPATGDYAPPYQIIKRAMSNYLGQTELVEYGDPSNTVVWSGYDPVTHQAMQTVVHQRHDTDVPTDDVTLMAFGYEYDVVGKLSGIVDWRGRGPSGTASFGLNVQHPSFHTGQSLGSHYPNFPSSKMDPNLPAPTSWNGSDVPSGDTGWPLGVTPSDALFEYDTQYQLVGEERKYINNLSGDYEGYDFPRQPDSSLGPARVRSLSWNFDARGSMTKWEEDWENAPNANNLGRALGSHIENGYQLNLANGCNMNWLATNNDLPPQGTCYIPDALYFANNIAEVGAGRGTCIWVVYDTGGKMKEQHIRTGCSTCEYDGNASDKGAAAASCADAPFDEGDPDNPLDDQQEVIATYTKYEYSWNALGQLDGATKVVDGDQKIAMSYIYGSSGARVIREKSDVISGDPTNIRQDIYMGGYERRQVNLIDTEDSDREVSINEALENLASGAADLGRYLYRNVDGTRLVKHAGFRVQWEYNDPVGSFDPPQMFLSLGNHLGSTSAVVDWSDGTLVEWKTNYAYGADESHWKNEDPKYANADEPYGFTGKEEDEAVGLHYFGARYYSSYLGRWLSPDAPVVHGGGFSNYFGYGSNSPYIYVDPDGNYATIIIGMILGAIRGAVSAALNGGNAREIIYSAFVGAVFGGISGAIGAAGPAANMPQGAALLLAGGIQAGFSAVQARATGANIGQAVLTGFVSGFSVLAGAAMGLSGLNQGAHIMLGYASSIGVSYIAAGVSGSLNRENADDILISSSLYYWGGVAGNAIGDALESSVGMRSFGTTLESLGDEGSSSSKSNSDIVDGLNLQEEGGTPDYDTRTPGEYYSGIQKVSYPARYNEDRAFKDVEKYKEHFEDRAAKGEVPNVPTNWSGTEAGRKEALYAYYLTNPKPHQFEYACWVIENWHFLLTRYRAGNAFISGFFSDPKMTDHGHDPIQYFNKAYEDMKNTIGAMIKIIRPGQEAYSYGPQARKEVGRLLWLEAQTTRLPTRGISTFMHGYGGWLDRFTRAEGGGVLKKYRDRGIQIWKI